MHEPDGVAREGQRLFEGGRVAVVLRDAVVRPSGRDGRPLLVGAQREPLGAPHGLERAGAGEHDPASIASDALDARGVARREVGRDRLGISDQPHVDGLHDRKRVNGQHVAFALLAEIAKVRRLALAPIRNFAAATRRGALTRARIGLGGIDRRRAVGARRWRTAGGRVGGR